MKVTIKSLDGTKTLVLGNDASGEYIEGFEPEQERRVRIEEYVRSEHVDVFPQLNRKNKIPFTVNKEHASRDAAFAFSLVHADSVPVVGQVTFAQGAITKQYAKAGIENVRTIVKGKTTITSYTVISGQVS
jgi:hypothetical protein